MLSNITVHNLVSRSELRDAAAIGSQDARFMKPRDVS